MTKEGVSIALVMTKRESNYDLLRVISALAIIQLHVSASYLDAITNESVFGRNYLDGIFVSSLYNVLARFAVPCFIMLAGAFILSDERNGDYKYFYRKTFVKVGIPTLIFSLLYLLYSLSLNVLSVLIRGGEISQLLDPLKDLIKGVPYSHMWYLYMMIGIYLLVPVLISLKKQIGEVIFEKITWPLLVISSLGYVTSTSTLNWDVGFSFRFVSYFMAGYEIRRCVSNKSKSNMNGAFFILSGLLVELIVVFMRYQQALKGIADADLQYKIVDPLCPLIVIASVLIFIGFSYLSLNIKLGKLPELTFYIYLLHAGIWSITFMFIMRVGSSWNNRIVIPLSIITLFIFSIGLSKIYLLFWNMIDKKWNITNKMCDIVKL